MPISKIVISSIIALGLFSAQAFSKPVDLYCNQPFDEISDGAVAICNKGETINIKKMKKIRVHCLQEDVNGYRIINQTSRKTDFSFSNKRGSYTCPGMTYDQDKNKYFLCKSWKRKGTVTVKQIKCKLKSNNLYY